MKKAMETAAAVFLIISPSALAAQDFSGAVTLSFGQSDISDVPEDISTKALSASGEIDFGNGFSFGADISTASLNIDDVPLDISSRTLGLDAAYRFGNGLQVGGYGERATLSVEGLGVDPKIDSYGLKAGYGMQGVELSLFLGRSETDPELPGLDIRDRGMMVKADISDAGIIAANWIETELSDGTDSLDISSLGLAGSYALAEDWTVFGGFTRTSIDLLDADVTTVGLGAGYDLGSVLNFDAIASVELSRSDLSVGGLGDGNVDTVRFGFTIPLGKRSTVPLNSVANSVLDPRHSVITGTAAAAF